VLRFALPLIPKVVLITATPLNLHKRFLTSGFLQTAVSDAPRSKWQVILGVGRGASDTALAFLDNFRLADNTPSVVLPGCDLPLRLALAQRAELPDSSEEN
jgi:hypothetical protein